MRGAVLADTGPLYATVDPRDDNFERAREDVDRLNGERLSVAVPFPVLCESYSRVLYRLGVGTARRWLGEIHDGASLFNPTPEDYGAARGVILAHPDQKSSLFDAVTAALSERLGLPVWSYDHHFDVMRVEVWRGS